jgi:hypothetical protein
MTVVKPEPADDTEQSDITVAPAADEVEGEIRAFVRRDISVFRRNRPEFGEVAVDGINAVIERVAGGSVREIDRVIAELAGIRDMLRSEGDRVQRDLANYASLSQAAMTSMKIIADSLAHWKSQAAQVGQGKS